MYVRYFVDHMECIVHTSTLKSHALEVKIFVDNGYLSLLYI